MPTNDDHPPSDIRAGQELVLSVYSALAHSDAWNRTMLVITYDEHGGFYDHFDPTTVPPPDDERPDFRVYGPRVPAIVVSPWVEARSTAVDANGERIVFDHTSLIKTILERFCRHDDATIPTMSARVNSPKTNHLGHLLTRDEPRQPPAFDHVLEPLKEFRGDRLMAMVESHAQGLLKGLPDLSDFQKQLLAARESLLSGGAFNRYFSHRTSLHGQLAPAAPGQEPPGHAPPPPPGPGGPH